MKTLIALALLSLPVLAFAAPAQGGDADVCYSPSKPDAINPQANLLTDSTVLSCPRAGKHTLPQLAQAGWSIVSVEPVATSMSVTQGTSAWMVVIEKKKSGARP
ncbi:hypothetical protein [Metallibacterium scheffleri]